MRYRDLEDRLLSNSVEIECGCWMWLRRLNNKGYPTLNIRDERGRAVPVYAHRLAYEIFTGRKIQDGFTIDHTCWNSFCINPSHLRELPGEENLPRSRY